MDSRQGNKMWKGKSVKKILGEPSTRGSPISYEFQANDPVDTGLKWILLLGRLIGIMPLSISLKKVSFKWGSFSAIHTLTLGVIMLVAVLPQLLYCIVHIGTFPTMLEEMVPLGNLFYQMSILFGYYYLLANGAKVVLFLQKRATTTQKLDLKTTDNGFPRFCIITTIFVLGMGIGENIFHDVCTFNEHGNLIRGYQFNKRESVA